MEVTRVQVYEDESGEYRWRALAGNNEKVADSGEGYVSKSYAMSTALALYPDATIEAPAAPATP